MFEADIQAAIDRQLLLERKAAAWDELREWYEGVDPRVVDVMDDFVHSAQAVSTGKPVVTQDAERK